MLKQVFVASILERIGQPGEVLDLGANTGEFSLLAAGRGHSVVALEAQALVLDRLVQDADAGETRILPVVANAAYPTPACGWLGLEQESLTSRLEKRFDLFLALALKEFALKRLEGSLSTPQAAMEWLSQRSSASR